MENKKSMYIPAPSLGKKQGGKRRTLAQGILITGESLEEEIKMSSPAPKELYSFGKSVENFGSPFSQVKRENEKYGTPRKLFPVSRSPDTQEPSADPVPELSVSDSDDELRQRKAEKSHQRFSYPLPEVTIVEATGPKLSADVSEVATRETVALSPAKVVCHSPPSRDTKRSPNSGIPDLINLSAGKMNESSVRSRRELTYESSGDTLEGSPVDRHSRAYPVELDNQFSNEQSWDSRKEEDSGAKTSEATGINDTVRSYENTAKEKKSKKVRVVKSRYLSSVSGKDKRDKKLAQESLDISKTARNSSTNVKTSSNVTDKGDVTMLQNISAIGPQRPKPLLKGQQTSTPFWATVPDRTGRLPDGSFIDLIKESKDHSGHQMTTSRVKKGTSPHVETEAGPMSDSGASGTQTSEGSGGLSELELSYARMIQAAYVKEKVANGFEHQQKDALGQLYAVWQENERLKDEIKTIEEDFAVKKYSLGLDQILQTQARGLALSESVLKKFEKDFRELAAALECVQLFMPLKDVTVSSGDHLSTALRESSALLEEINQLTEGRSSQLEKLAVNLEKLQAVKSTGLPEHAKCAELLTKALSLSREEQSLQAGLVEGDYKSSWEM